MISGYFSVKDNRLRMKGLVTISKEIVLYGMLQAVFMIIFRFFGLSSEGFGTAFQSAFLPITGNVWWFTTAYIFLMIMSPALNLFFNRLTKKGYLLALAFIWVFMLTLDGLFGNQYYSLERGIMFYASGGYIRRFEGDKDKTQLRQLMYHVIMFLAGCLVYIVSYYIVAINYGQGRIAKLADTSASSLATVLCAVSLFLLFRGIDFKNITVNKVASLVFGVYLIHDSSFGRRMIWDNLFQIQWLYRKVLFPMYAVLIIAIVFTAGCLIDYLRIIITNVIDNRIRLGLNRIKNDFISS